MNKKGFTLIELLATIAIIAIVATIASINFLNIFNNNEKEDEKRKDNILESAACVYIELKENSILKQECLENGCEITAIDLIKKGLVFENDVDKSAVINIYKINNEKKCAIKN